MKTVSSPRVAQQPAPRRGRGSQRAKAVRGSQRPSGPRALHGPAADSLQGELSAVRDEVGRVAANVKAAIQKLDRLMIAVADLHDDVADLQASLGDGEVEYGPVEEDNSEMGEGHA
ncbi:MAG: hypothetical protein HY207_08605 [Nitrospirae bacterium]|nr:hypothetical protein [Nitrospirota bacterium]